MSRSRNSHHYGERGESLLGTLVALTLASIALTASTSFFIASAKHSTDIRASTQAQVRASTLLDLMTSELRMLGSGMPLSQSSFSPTDATLGDAPLPVLLSATATEITFRFNPFGRSTMLTTDFNPASHTTATVESTTGFSVGDTVYLSSYSAGGTHGLRGVITALTPTTIGLGSVVTASGATFPASSLVHPVVEVTYTSNDSGVTRTTSEGSTVTLPQAQFTLTYLDQSQQAITLPLTTSALDTRLSAVRVTIHSTHSSRFDTATDTTLAQQTVALRNIILNR